MRCRRALGADAARDARGRRQAASNIVWNYGHTTIPRHLRDIDVTEYGIADLRGQTDEDCVVGDAGDRRRALPAPALLGTAQAQSASCARDFALPRRGRATRRNALRDALAPFRADGTLPDYPLGSDFTAVEQRLVKALGWLKANTATTRRQAAHDRGARCGRATQDAEALERMELAAPKRLWRVPEARLLRWHWRNCAPSCSA